MKIGEITSMTGLSATVPDYMLDLGVSHLLVLILK